jgi:uncharacterized repeat protein (TIGR03803 family)
MDSAGNLYGTTQKGGTGCPSPFTPGCGVVFKIDPAGNETVLYSFTGANGDGAFPFAGLILDSAGNLYGTTNSGGAAGGGFAGPGTVFKVDPTGHETVLHSFTGLNGDGANPFGGRLVRDSAGNLYGTTLQGGGLPGGNCGNGCGIVFELMMP